MLWRIMPALHKLEAVVASWRLERNPRIFDHFVNTRKPDVRVEVPLAGRRVVMRGARLMQFGEAEFYVDCGSYGDTLKDSRRDMVHFKVRDREFEAMAGQ